MKERLTRRLLLASRFVSGAAAKAAKAREEQWMLKQPRKVRQSFVEDVLDRGDEPVLQEIWMLRQSDEVRESYIRDVLEPELPTDE